MNLWVFRNEPGTSAYCFCTKQPQPIYGDDMRRVVYTDYGELMGCIPSVTFEALFRNLRFESGGYRRVRLDYGVDEKGVNYYKLTEIRQ